MNKLSPFFIGLMALSLVSCTMQIRRAVMETDREKVNASFEVQWKHDAADEKTFNPEKQISDFNRFCRQYGVVSHVEPLDDNSLFRIRLYSAEMNGINIVADSFAYLFPKFRMKFKKSGEEGILNLSFSPDDFTDGAELSLKTTSKIINHIPDYSTSILVMDKMSDNELFYTIHVSKDQVPDEVQNLVYEYAIKDSVNTLIASNPAVVPKPALPTDSSSYTSASVSPSPDVNMKN